MDSGFSDKAESPQKCFPTLNAKNMTPQVCNNNLVKGINLGTPKTPNDSNSSNSRYVKQQEQQEHQRISKSCLGCRKIKMKCTRTSTSIEDPCLRCKNSGRECITITKQVGRKRGSKNKYTDLNKFLRSLEQDNKNQGQSQSDIKMNSISDQKLTKLLTEAIQAIKQEELLPMNITNNEQIAESNLKTPSSILPSLENNLDEMYQNNATSLTTCPDNLSNPLGLLARVTEVLRKQNAKESNNIKKRKHSDSFELQVNEKLKRSKLDTFQLTQGSLEGLEYLASIGQPTLSKQKDDIPSGIEYFASSSLSRYDSLDPDLDPIGLAIISEEEAETLFKFFHSEMKAIAFVLDEIYTPSFVRKDSPFLFTAICFCAAQFCPKSNKALAKRLDIHFHQCADLVISRQYRSISIVNAFCIGSGWKPPERRISLEKTWTYLSHATSLAIELGIHTSTSIPLSDGDMLSVREAHSIQDDLNHHGLTVESEISKRILRSKQKTWMNLYLWGSGLALTLKRPWTIRAEDVVVATNWHESNLASEGDKLIIGLTHLRQTTEITLREISQNGSSQALEKYNESKLLIKNRLDKWYTEWLGGSKPYLNLSIPYSKLLLKHGELLLLASAMKHSFGAGQVPDHAVKDGLDTAVFICNIVTQELRADQPLKYMPNNVALSVLYATVCGLQLLSMAASSDEEKLQVLGTLGSTAFYLEKLGSDCIYEFGIPTLYGRHLKELLSAAAIQLFPCSNSKYATKDSGSESIPESDETEYSFLDTPTATSTSVSDLEYKVLSDKDAQANMFGLFPHGLGGNPLFGESNDIFDPLDLGLNDEYFKVVV